MMKRIVWCCGLALTLSLLAGCGRDSVPPPPGPLTVKDSHGVSLLSVGPLKDSKPAEGYGNDESSVTRSVKGQTSYHTDAGIITLYAGGLADADRYSHSLFNAAIHIDQLLRIVATDLQETTVGGQPAVGLKCSDNIRPGRTGAVVIFHSATGDAWFTLDADTAHFDKAWASVISSIKVAQSVPPEKGTALLAPTDRQSAV